MEHHTFSFQNRVLSVCYPKDFREYTEALAKGYQVATNDEQRAAWGLESFPDLPVISHDEAMALLFADPADEQLGVHGVHDRELLENPDNFDADGQFVGEEEPAEARVEVQLTVQPRSVGRSGRVAPAPAAQ